MTLPRAFELASNWHLGQKRKYTGAPYIQHLAAVHDILVEWGFYNDPELLEAALLHDVIEDTHVPISIIRNEFGEQVAEWVWWLTDHPIRDNREMRKTITRWRLARAPWQAQIIKAADISDNTKDIIKHDPKFAPVYLAEALATLEAMVQTCKEFSVLCRLDIVRNEVKALIRG